MKKIEIDTVHFHVDGLKKKEERKTNLQVVS